MKQTCTNLCTVLVNNKTNSSEESIMNVVRYFQLLEQYRLAETDEQKKLILAEIDREQGGDNKQLLTED